MQTFNPIWWQRIVDQLPCVAGNVDWTLGVAGRFSEEINRAIALRGDTIEGEDDPDLDSENKRRPV